MQKFIIATFATLAAATSAHAQGPSATASHILVKEESLATKIKDFIAEKKNNGADAVKLIDTFGAFAEKFSTCPSGKSSKGSLGNFTQGQMVPAFDKVIFDAETKMGEVYGPVETQFGSHLILVTNRTGVVGEEEGIPALEEAELDAMDDDEAAPDAEKELDDMDDDDLLEGFQAEEPEQEL